MYSCYSCDVLLPDPAGSRVTTVCSTDPSSMCFSCFLHPSKDESTDRMCCSVSEIILRQHSNTHLCWDFVRLFTTRSVNLIVKLSGLGTSSRLTVHWTVVEGFAVGSLFFDLISTRTLFTSMCYSVNTHCCSCVNSIIYCCRALCTALTCTDLHR